MTTDIDSASPENHNTTPDYRKADLPVDLRVRDLLSRMTLREKVRQMDQYVGTGLVDKISPLKHIWMAPDGELVPEKVTETLGEEGVGCIHDLYPTSADIPNAIQDYARTKTRLGIPVLFAEEALHGVMGPGYTVFPQAIAMAATFNPDLVERVGRAIAAEARSRGIHETFHPVIDLARDPRWGRIEETYGEDTHLSARMAAAMVRGLQGKRLDDPRSVVAEPKHFAAYGIPQGGLNCAPASVGRRELETFILPVFEAAIAEAGALNAMCSYNAIDGVPCSGDRWLLTEVLRDRWAMRGFVRSDLGAVRDLHLYHATADSSKEAIRQTVAAGLDMQYYDYSHKEYQDTLVELVEEGRLAMDDIDRAAGAVLRVKFLLGLFEDASTDPSLAGETIRCEAHVGLSLEVARQSICLLKNEGDLLPLSKSLKKIAVVGPSAAVARLGDYTPAIEGFEPVTLLEGIRSMVGGDAEVVHVKGCGITEDELDPVPSSRLRTPESEPGLRAEYFATPDCSGEPVLERTDPHIDFNWALAKPDEAISADTFSVRWTGTLVPEVSGEGRLGAVTNDSMRIWLDGESIVDGWGEGKSASTSVPVTFEAGREYALTVEYRKDGGGVMIRLGWNLGGEGIEAAAEAARGAEVAIVAVGGSIATCGEWFDRTSLDLPGNQQRLVEAVAATGTPTVVVLQNGRPLTVNWIAENIPAIVEAWYPGEQGGRAMAEVLFGEVNPSGRLPVTFPRSVGQLPMHYNRYPAKRHGYVDEEMTPLYPFGFGLSYTTFEYSHVAILPQKTGPAGVVEVTVEVTNTGERAGEEVVQCYVRDVASSVITPMTSLKGAQRVRLEPGETRSISFELGPKDLALLDRNFNWVVEPGEFEVTVGPHSGQGVTGVFRVV